MAAPVVNLADVQGLVYSGFKRHPYAGFLFATLGPDVAAAKAWLGGLDITSADRDAQKRASHIQLALSATGLAALGATEAEVDALPQELKLGMAERRRILGDTPEAWTLGNPNDDRLDAVVMVYAASDAALRTLLDHHRAALVAIGARVRPDEIAWRFAEHEHFGFADGLSQPFVPGLHAQRRPGQEPVELGEILLGYPNAYGKMPKGPELGVNGTYLVFRKLAQDVPALWTWLAARAAALGCSPELLGAKLMGRWPSGAPLVLAPDADDPALTASDRVNDFAYLADDPDGLRCPIASHVRRANPRDARGGSKETSEMVVGRHRILRRGRSWGPPISIADALASKGDGTARGLYFIGLGASIARSFEFIQQTWLGNPGFHGLAGEPDPITGPGGCPFTIPDDPVRLRLHEVPRIVTTLGGGYFMLPSLTALAQLATRRAA